MNTRALSWVLIVASAVALWTIRLNSPPDLMTSDQERPASYVLDAVRNGHWVCQRDWTGDITSKPPMYTWLAALATLPFDHINRFSLTLPAALSTVAIGLIIFTVGEAQFGWAAGFLGAMMYLLSFVAAKQVVLVRTDGLFALTVTLTALAGYRAWTKGGGWIWFWLAAAMSTLTKGPLGVGLGAMGLLAAVWEFRSGTPAPLKGNQINGIVVYLALVVGWFLWAYSQMGHALLDKLLSRELVGNAMQAHDMHVVPGQWFYKPPLYFLSRLAPWSLFACLGFWRVCWKPAVTSAERRFERFLFCWFFVGLVPFSLAASQRADHLFPLMPAAALLGGRELARLLERKTRGWIIATAAPVLVISLGLIAVYYNVVRRKQQDIVRTVGMSRLAGEVRAQGGKDFPLVYVDAPFALQFYLNTMEPAVSMERATELLRGSPPAFAAVRDFPALQKQLGPAAAGVHEVARWPDAGEAFVRIIGNRPRLMRPE